MKKYFSKITSDYWTPKNQAHKDAKAVASDMERRILDHSQINNFKKEFGERIDEVNKKNKRCKDLHFSIWNSPINKGDIIFSISGLFTLYIFYSKN